MIQNIIIKVSIVLTLVISFDICIICPLINSNVYYRIKRGTKCSTHRESHRENTITREYSSQRKEINFPSVPLSKRIASRNAEKIPRRGMSPLMNRKEGRRSERRTRNAWNAPSPSSLSSRDRTGLILDPRIPLRASTGCLLQAMGVRRDGNHDDCIWRGNARSDGGCCIDCTLSAGARATLTFAQLTMRMTASWASHHRREDVGKPVEN